MTQILWITGPETLKKEKRRPFSLAKANPLSSIKLLMVNGAGLRRLSLSAMFFFAVIPGTWNFRTGAAYSAYHRRRCADRPFAHRRLQDFEHGEWDEPHPRAVFLPRLGQLRLEHRVDAMADVRDVLVLSSRRSLDSRSSMEEGEGSELKRIFHRTAP